VAPLGYQVQDRMLVIAETEAKSVASSAAMPNSARLRLLKDELEACRVTSDRGEIVHKNQSSIGSSVMRFRPQLAGNADRGAVAAAFPEGSWSASDREAVQRTPR
jgi:hypothetical protein